MWDANWPHRGAGNNSNIDRIQLHLVFASKWMFSMEYSDLPVGISGEDVRAAQREISRQYNDGKKFDDLLTDVGYWVARITKEDQMQTG